MARDVTSNLKLAIQQLEKDRDRIQGQIDSLKRILAENGTSPGRDVITGKRPGRRGRRQMSAKERAAVGKRMKAYWAKRRAARKKKGKAA
jgi:hypothetical protein